MLYLDRLKIKVMKENKTYGVYSLKYKNQNNQTTGVVETKKHWDNIRLYVLNKANIGLIEHFNLSYTVNNTIIKEIVI